MVRELIQPDCPPRHQGSARTSGWVQSALPVGEVRALTGPNGARLVGEVAIPREYATHLKSEVYSRFTVSDVLDFDQKRYWPLNRFIDGLFHQKSPQ